MLRFITPPTMSQFPLPALHSRLQSALTLLLLISAGAFGELAFARHHAARAIGDTLPMSATAPHSAFFVMRPEDCDGNLDVLDLFQRPAIRERVELRAIVVLGSDRLSSDATRLLRARGIRSRVVRADDDLLRRLAESGWRSTPLIMVVDRNRTMRATMTAPSSIPAYLAVASALQALPRS